MTTKLLTSQEVATFAGISYRQVDYWVRLGFLPVAREARGSGTRRGFDVRAVFIARIYASAQRALTPEDDPRIPWPLAIIAEQVNATPTVELSSSDPFEIKLSDGARLMLRNPPLEANS